ncbi:hypothetical protein HBI60_062270 [Parastagonospora nodorum]|nr:hypothetical protein HBI60_062270 [Parastagonospora nodorum]
MILALTSVSPSSMIANTNVKNIFSIHMLSLLFSSLRVYLIVNCSTDAMS